MFHQHVDFYANKSISTVKCMKIIGNSIQDINPFQKWLLYRSCILPIALYGFQLWYYKCAPMAYHLKILGKIQRRAAIWILRAFKTSPSYSIEALAGLIPINLHLQKLGGYSQLRVLWDAWTLTILFFFSFLFLILYWFSFLFLLFFFWTMKRHVTSHSHDKSHDVTS